VPFSWNIAGRRAAPCAGVRMALNAGPDPSPGGIFLIVNPEITTRLQLAEPRLGFVNGRTAATSSA